MKLPHLNSKFARSLLVAGFGLAVLFPAGLAIAQSSDIPFTPEVKIPGQFDQTTTASSDLIARYIRAIYVYFIWIVGVIATAMVTLNGVKWVAAAGDPARIQDAREGINSAVIGIIIALTSYLLLRLISPQFTIFKLPELKSSGSTFLDTGVALTVCDINTQRERGMGCGQFLETATDTFCIATGCRRELFQRASVCELTKSTINGKTGYTSGTCKLNVVVSATSRAEYAGHTLQAHASLVAKEPLTSCGIIGEQVAGNVTRHGDVFGAVCEGDNGSQGRVYFCYVDGNEAVIGPHGNKIGNFFCPKCRNTVDCPQ